MTKEKAITVINNHKEHWERLLREEICDETEGKETIESFAMAISALSDYDKMQKISLDLAFENDELMNKSRWIPVSERLPEEDGEYLVTKRAVWTGKEEVDISRWYEDDIETNNGFYKADKVIAWQPLPEPYKAEKEVTE